MTKDFNEIADNIGEIDLTSYVNFAQIKKIAQSNKNSKINVLTTNSDRGRTYAIRIVFGVDGDKHA